MLLRWLVGNYFRQTAEDLYQRAVTQAARVASRSPALSGVVHVPADCQAAVVFALGIESFGLVDKLVDPAAGKFRHSVERFGMLGSQCIRVADVGVGAEQARQGVEELLARGAVPWIVSAGFAGALQPHLQRGDIVMAESIVDSQQQPMAVGFHIDPQVVAQTPHLHVGRLLTVDHVVSTADERQQLAETYQALACDMESMAILRVCRDRHIRFLSVRIITDAFDDQLPVEIEALLHQHTLAGKLGAAAGALRRRPSSFKDLWRLRDDARRASQRLAGFLEGVLPQLTVEG